MPTNPKIVTKTCDRCKKAFFRKEDAQINSSEFKELCVQCSKNVNHEK